MSLPLRCPCCGYRTLDERSAYEICPVCFWEDDGQDDATADEVRGGPNKDLSLTQARANYAAYGAGHQDWLKHVRPPTSSERMRRVAVYCGSNFGADPLYAEVAREVGRTLAARGIGVVYGGGRLGLMGAVADAALRAGGEVFGVIPEVLVEAEAAHPGLTQLDVVPGMHERKARMTELADAFVTLPGGVGTMDELFEALSWGLLGYHAKPVGLLDVGGYYRDLVAFMDGMTAAGFLRPAHRENLVVAEEIGALLDKLAAHVMPPTVVDMDRGRGALP